MYAIIKTGGKQYRISPGDVLRVERLPGERGDEVILDQVLLVTDGDAVGAIALGGDAGIPVVKGGGAGLHFDLFDPGIFPGRLIKMAVDDHISLGRDFYR